MNPRLLSFVKGNFSQPACALDLGSGNDLDMKGLVDLGWQVQGVEQPVLALKELYSADHPMDLIYSNNVLQFINDKDSFVDTCLKNLKDNGYLFIQTFAKGDKIMKNKTFSERELELLFRDKFRDVKIEKLTVDDDDFLIGPHQHEIFLLTAKK